MNTFNVGGGEYFKYDMIDSKTKWMEGVISIKLKTDKTTDYVFFLSAQ